jgi:hypothetical protein
MVLLFSLAKIVTFPEYDSPVLLHNSSLLGLVFVG